MVEPVDVSDDPITKQIIGAAIDVHRSLGPGLLESAYEACLCHELSLRELSFQRQLSLPVNYKECRLDVGYRIDLLVAESVIVEIKACEDVTNAHLAQLMTYMRLSSIRRGLLLNFNCFLLKDGIFRRVL